MIDVVNSTVLEVLTDIETFNRRKSFINRVCQNRKQKRKLNENFKEKESQGYICNNSQQVSAHTLILLTCGSYSRHDETVLSCNNKTERHGKRLDSVKNKSGK